MVRNMKAIGWMTNEKVKALIHGPIQRRNIQENGETIKYRDKVPNGSQKISITKVSFKMERCMVKEQCI